MQPYLIPVLPNGPSILRRTMSRIPEDRWDIPTHPGRFTPREVMAHMADWEPILLKRMEQTLNDSGSTIMGQDEGEMAIRNGYATSDWQEQAKLFADRRAATVEWLKAVPNNGWECFAVHNERGRMNLYEQANMLLGHDLYHIEQLHAVLD